jgi:uncharacterized SAM-binding protein YcdF (DUF218 family)
VLGTVPVGDWLLYQLEHRFPQMTAPPTHVDGIILLGGEINARRTLESGQPSLGRSARLLAFADLARRFPDARLVFTGGIGSLFDTHTEAEAMPIAFRAVGIDPDRVLLESRSRNTYENAIYSRDLVSPQPGETWLLVTSAAHMPRAVGTFRRAGFPVIAYPTEMLTRDPLDWKFRFTFDGGFNDLGQPLKEIIGLAAYRALDRTDSWFPAP